ncbi:trypsin, alkaline A [Bombyx mori]|uniref:Peptidase S1 domain-containing protein n=1 Tax=Bombyx mori TaxID=7091 RepID=A0A8R2AMX4_BOMMO|nr:trypsin, alkaline A [Bombyx mori]
MTPTLVLLLLVGAVAAIPDQSSRIVGGTATTIDRYPTMAAALFSSNMAQWWQGCGCSILNNRAVLTAAHCIIGDRVGVWRVRVGSSFGNSGGVVHEVNRHIIHPNYNHRTKDADIAIMRTVLRINFVRNTVQPARIAGSNYNLADNQVVWAAGWGSTRTGSGFAEQLRHVQVWTINQAICRERYSRIDRPITANMLCSGWLDVGGRDQCGGDSGGPLYHNGVVVGVCSWGFSCGSAFYPGVNVRVSRFSSWIQNNA